MLPSEHELQRLYFKNLNFTRVILCKLRYSKKVFQSVLKFCILHFFQHQEEFVDYL